MTITMTQPQLGVAATLSRGRANSATAMTRLDPVLMLWQPKGGCNKSVTTATAAFLMTEDGFCILGIDTDPTNPDVYRAHHGEMRCECIALDNENGFTSIARRISDARITGPILISGAAGNVEAFKDNAATLGLSAARVGRRFKMVVPIDLDTDSLIHIEDMAEALPEAEILIVRPRYFGRPEEFEVFNESDLGRKFLAERRVIDLPAVPAALVRRFKTDRMSFCAVAQKGDVADVAALDVWRPKARAALAPLLDW